MRKNKGEKPTKEKMFSRIFALQPKEVPFHRSFKEKVTLLT